MRWPIGLCGALYLMWLACNSWRAAGVEFLITGGDVDAKKSALRAGVWLSVTNPQNIAYWGAIGSAMGAVGVHEPSTADYAVFFAGFMVSSVGWAFFCTAWVDRMFARDGQRCAKATYRLCAVAFVALALSTLRDLVSPAEATSPTERPAMSTPR